MSKLRQFALRNLQSFLGSFKVKKRLASIKTHRLGVEALEKRDLLAAFLQSVTANGGTQLALTYEIQQPVTAFDVGFYRSADAAFGGDTLLDTVTISDPADLTVGIHVKSLAIGGGANQVALPGAGTAEVGGEYSLLAVANALDAVLESTAVFSGVYHAPGSDVFVHGRGITDMVTINSNHQVHFNGSVYAYAAADVATFRVRGHLGNDFVNGATASKVLWINGGAGDDVLTGGSAADLLFGEDGNDLLTGGRGDDQLDGGQGGDTYTIAGMNDGTDRFIDAGTTGIDRIKAGAHNAQIRLSQGFSAASSGIEAISGNGFTNVSLRGPSTADSLNFAGMTLTGLALIDSGAGADTILGSDANDEIRGGSGDDLIDGGAGWEVAVYPGTRASYSITLTGDVIRITDLDPTMSGDDGTDTLSNVECVQFLDEEVILTTLVNHAPIAMADSISVAEDSGVTMIPVLANDTDPDVGDTMRVLSVNSAGVRGIVQVVSGGSGVIYFPNNAHQGLRAGETATETFTYTMADRAGAQSTATVTVTVIGANDNPFAWSDTATVSEDGSSVTINVLANDTDADVGDTRTVISLDGSGRPAGYYIVFIYGGGGAPLPIPAIPAIRGTVSVTPDGQSVVYSPGSAFQDLRVGQTATETFFYTMVDGAGAQSVGQVTVTVTGANDGPVAVADSVTVARNAGPVTINVLANDTDVDAGDPRTVASINTTGLQGSASIAPGGSGVVYSVGSAFQSLGAGQTATETFSYTIVDSAGAQSTAIVTVTVTGSNTAPVAVADSAAATENGPAVTIDVLANDTDADVGDTRIVVSVNGTGLQGTVSVAPGGSAVIYSVGNAFQSLRAGATATETFTYTMADGFGAQSTAMVTVTITGVNDAPVAVANSATVSEDDGAVTIDVLTNDTDVDVGDTRTVVSVNGAGLQGTVSVAPGGSGVVYTVGSTLQSLRVGQTATQSFTYTMADGSGATSTATVTMVITGANDAPVAVPNSLTVSEDAAPTTIAVLANDTDVDTGDTKRVVSVNITGLLGSVTIAPNGSSVVYAVGSAFQHLIAGQTATETFSYTMADAAGAQSTTTVTVTVTGVTDGPRAIDDVAAIGEDDGPITINVLANDLNDLNPGDVLTITSVDGAGALATPIVGFFDGAPQFIGMAPGFARLLGQVSIAPDGRSIRYTPLQSLNAGEVGTDKFKYTITGSGGSTSTGIVTVTVAGANDAPVATEDSATAAAGGAPITIPVLANDRDPDTRIDPPLPPIPPSPFSELIFDPTPADVPDTKTVVAVNGSGLQGSVAIATGGTSVIYTVGGSLLSLPFGQTATETFSYTMVDGSGVQSTAQVTVTVTGRNHAPIAAADSAAATENGAPVTISVLVNDTDADTSLGDTLSVVSVNGAGLQGTVAISPGGSGVVYTIGNAFQSLRAGVTAVETFSYTVADRLGVQSTATVTVTVTGVNDAPVAVANSVTVSEDAGPLTINVLANDTDIDAGDTKTVVSVNGAGLLGTVSVTPDGSGVIYSVGSAFQYLAAGQTATETFTYTMADSAGAQSTATVTVIVIGANEPVVIVTPPPPPPGAIVGTAGDDIINPSAAADTIYGEGGDDEINAGGGADTIFGGSGDDEIDGGAGDDVINGGAGRDDLTGGLGADLFRFYVASESTPSGYDRIRDFNSAQGDRIDLSLIDANTVVGGNNDFIVSASFTGVAGQLVIASAGAGVYMVRGDVNGDGVADFQIEVRTAGTLSASDFLL